MRRRGKLDSLRTGPKLPLAPMEELVALCLKRSVLDESLSYLLKKVSQRRGLLHLCCKKLKVYTVSKENINILGMVQLNSIQDLKLNCTWKLSTLRKFTPFLGQMGNLRRFLLSHVFTSSHTTLEQEEHCVSLFTAQFRRLSCLQELYLDDVSILKGRLDQILSCLKTPLETLSITSCILLESDLRHLSQHLNVSQLKVLNLRRLNLTNISSGPSNCC
ncbi:unnamed protein product [Pipistrellus nathusii]|uniref:Uncharacterized protein n=1 Tax=Pipistrellus nathusii TaxID=59473 RepID=A0ABP0AKE8_PIPNA